MAEALIIDVVRTPVGRRGGGLREVHPADLGAVALRALIHRTGVQSDVVDDVVFGCLDQVGPQCGNVARTAWLAAGLPETVPATTVDRQCGSSQQALHFAAQAVLAGVQDLVIAGGVQNMSMVPIGTARQAGVDRGLPGALRASGWLDRYGDQEVQQLRAAELLAEHWQITRDDMEMFSVESHERALRAQAEGRFTRELVSVGGVDRDEGPRPPDWDKIRSLRPLIEGGRLTAAVSSQISDGAAGMLVASERAAERHGLVPRARVHHMTVLGDDPIMMLAAPIPATRRALQKTGLTLDDIDVIEINEAFASVVLAWAKELDADLTKVNVTGGAIALGHPLGATGARLMATLLGELDRIEGRYGLQVMCEGGGLANLTIVERLT